MFAFAPGPPGTLSFEPGPGGRLVETGADGALLEIGRIVEWAPGRQLVFTGRQSTFAAGQETEVTIRFDAVGAATRVTVEHRGWDAIAQDRVERHGFPNAVFLQRHGEWWQALLNALRRRIDATSA